jgi:hypothetical protein
MRIVDGRLLTAARPKGAAMRRGMIAALIIMLLGAPLRIGSAFPLSGDQTVLPPGTELNEEAFDKPREVFRSEALGGAKSYMVNLCGALVLSVSHAAPQRAYFSGLAGRGRSAASCSPGRQGPESGPARSPRARSFRTRRISSAKSACSPSGGRAAPRMSGSGRSRRLRSIGRGLRSWPSWRTRRRGRSGGTCVPATSWRR